MLISNSQEPLEPGDGVGGLVAGLPGVWPQPRGLGDHQGGKAESGDQVLLVTWGQAQLEIRLRL